MIQNSISSFVNSVIYILIGLFAGLNQIMHLKGPMRSNSLWLHGLFVTPGKHARLPCLSPYPGTCSNLCPLSWWCYLTILSCAALSSVCLQSFPALGNFLVSHLFESDGQVLQLQHQSFQWIFRVDFFYDFFYKFLYDFLAVKETLNSLLQHHNSEASILWCSALFMVQLSHPYMTIGKTIALTRQTFIIKVLSLFLNMLSRFLITFLPRNKHLLISWLQSKSTVILEPKKIVCPSFHFFAVK